MSMRSEASLLPELRWNTHLACLARLSDAAAAGLDLADIAGLTGLGFRTILCRRVSPASLYQTWSHSAWFRLWTARLGLDADIGWHDMTLPTSASWLNRQHALIDDTLARGFPVLHYDNLAFGLILGSDADTYYLSGIPAYCVHPLWLEQPSAAALLKRLRDPADTEEPRPLAVPKDEIRPLLDNCATFVYVHAVSRQDAELAAAASVLDIADECGGRQEYPRIRDDSEHLYDALSGMPALERWREEMAERRIELFGQIQAVQSLAEARRLGWQYLRRLPDRLPGQYRGRLEQAAGFFERSVAHWRAAQQAFSPPVDPENQLTRQKLEICREAVYQVTQTEQTAGRLLAGLACDLKSEYPL